MRAVGFTVCLLLLVLPACHLRQSGPQPRVYRGYLFAEGEFRPCQAQEGVAWTLADPDRVMDAVRKEMPPPPTPGVFWDLLGTLSNNELRVIGVRRASVDPHLCGEELGRARLRAGHSEPSWSAEVLPDGLSFRAAGTGLVAFTKFELQAHEKEQVYKAGQNGRSLSLTIKPEACWDRSVPTYFFLKAEAVLDGRTFTGCAYEGWKAN